MPTPLATTTGRIERPADSADDATLAELEDGHDTDWRDSWDEERPPQVVERGIACTIGEEAGSAQRDGGNTPALRFKLSADLCDLRKDDYWVDERTLARYRVDWVQVRRSTATPMLDRVVAQLSRVDGATVQPAG